MTCRGYVKFLLYDLGTKMAASPDLGWCVRQEAYGLKSRDMSLVLQEPWCVHLMYRTYKDIILLKMCQLFECCFSWSAAIMVMIVYDPDHDKTQ